ncbi:uncharacterized protein LOC132720273 isoform X2 [Ruditapes philippinarum]|uniref:uncharacterized protein LOC132720273 isoform X2 n=1 Tax=Ruditapes philippinarum TaxID=129788 RepID=UPI00295BB04E|nr:uncharacterized protein LOC132720273 isoform X2 [Ruditapes philippinarum]
MLQEKDILDHFMNEKGNLSSTHGRQEPSHDEETDQVPGKKSHGDEGVEVNEGNAVDDNTKYFITTDHVSKDVGEVHKVKSKEGKCISKIRKVKRSHKRKLHDTFNEEMDMPRNLSSNEIKRSNIRHLFAAWLIFHVQRLSLKTGAFVWATLLLSMQFSLVTTSPIQITKDATNEYDYSILKASQCNGIGVLRPRTCGRNEKMFNIYIEFCGFAAMCDPGYKPICIDGDDDETIYFCSPYNLTCKKGYRRKVRKKEADPDLVIVKEEKCPLGTYQPSESDCYNSCAYRHESLEDLPSQYAVYSSGDNASPAMVYCDFHRGFYNPNGNFLTRYDREMTYSSFQCTNVKEHNPCHGVMSPLPDGSCVEPCEAGHSRDVYDNFRCTKNNIVENPEKTATKSGSKDDDGYERFQADDKHEIEWITPVQSENTSTQNWHVTVIIVMVIAALLFTVGSMIVICCTRKGSTCM